MNEPTLDQPTARQIAVTEWSVSRSKAAARSSRLVSRYSWGDSPKASLKRRLKCAVESWAARARSATVNGSAKQASARSLARRSGRAACSRRSEGDPVLTRESVSLAFDQTPSHRVRSMSETGTFASTTSVISIGPGRWRADVPPGWDVMGNVNGGVLLAVAARALGQATSRPDPLSITGHFLTPGNAGAFEIDTEVLRQGRRLSTARALVKSGEQGVLAVLGTFGEQAQRSEVLLSAGGPPDLPPPDECVRVVPTETFPAPLVEHVDTRLHPADATFLDGEPSGSTTLRSWLRLPHDEQIDTLGLLYLVDAHPPTIFNADFPLSWTPTIELTVHVRGRPAPGWVRSVASTRFVSDGFLEIDVELWDEQDMLVAQARQLALVPRGRSR